MTNSRHLFLIKYFLIYYSIPRSKAAEADFHLIRDLRLSAPLREKILHLPHGKLRSLFFRVAVDACGDAGEGEGLAAVLHPLMAKRLSPPYHLAGDVSLRKGFKLIQ